MTATITDNGAERTVLDHAETYATSRLAGRELDARKALAAMTRELEKTSPPDKAKADAATLAERWLNRAEAEATAQQTFDALASDELVNIERLGTEIDATIGALTPAIEGIGRLWDHYHAELDRLAGDNDPLAALILERFDVTSPVTTLSNYLRGEHERPSDSDGSVSDRLDSIESVIADIKGIVADMHAKLDEREAVRQIQGMTANIESLSSELRNS